LGVRQFFAEEHSTQDDDGVPGAFIVRAEVAERMGGDPCGRPGGSPRGKFSNAEEHSNQDDDGVPGAFIVRAGVAERMGGDPCGRPGGSPQVIDLHTRPRVAVVETLAVALGGLHAENSRIRKSRVRVKRNIRWHC
jgi:hypothetical protein